VVVAGLAAGGLAAVAQALAPGTVVLVTRNADGTHASGGTHYSAVSTNGKCVAFDSSSPTLPGATGDRQIYVRDLDAGTTELVSANNAGTGGGDGQSAFPVITPDCRYVAFDSEATDLTGATLSQRHVYRRDLQTDATVLISRATTAAGAPGNSFSNVPSISDDGNRISFTSVATNLSTDDYDGALHTDVFVRKVTEAETLLASRNDADAAQDSTGGAGYYTDISSDGKKVAFQSLAGNMSTEDDNSVADVFIRDIDADTTVFASRADGSTGAAADGSSADPSVNADGSKVVFLTGAQNLGASGDQQSDQQVVMRDVTAGTTQVVSRASGATGAVANALSGGDVAEFLSSDGTRVAFWSQATNLDPDATVPGSHIYVRDLTTSTTTLETRTRSGAPATAGVEFGFAPDGSVVSFLTADQIAADDTDSGGDIYARGVGPTAGGTPSPIPPGPPASVADTTPPVFATVSLSNGTFAVDPNGTPELSVARKKPPKGTTFRYTLSEAARVVFTIDRSSTGRKAGKRCVKQTRANRKRKKCTRFARAGRFAVNGVAGANRHKFSGRIGGKTLKPGSYRATLVATDASGNASVAKRLTFKIVRR
jgi:hypothetical protein